MNVEVSLMGSQALSKVFLKYEISENNWYFLVGFTLF